MGLLVFLVRPIAEHYIDVDSILFDPAASEIFYFKHDVGASNVIIFIGSPDVNSLKWAFNPIFEKRRKKFLKQVYLREPITILATHQVTKV